MSFIIDQQTLSDLNLMGRYRTDSVFSAFNRTRTAGGELLLEQLFNQPLADADAINERLAIIRAVQTSGIRFTADRRLIAQAADYLEQDGPASVISRLLVSVRDRINDMLYGTERVQAARNELLALEHLQTSAALLLEQMVHHDKDIAPLSSITKALASSIAGCPVINLADDRPLSVYRLAVQQSRYSGRYRAALQQTLALVYQLDVYTAVAGVAASRGLCYPQACTYASSKTFLAARNLRHIHLKYAVGNDVSLGEESNLFFLTGANMAGKSTWMKALGTAFYLGHIGFPVPAVKMEFIVTDGLITSINVPDQINKGWSHFYAEVMRVKTVAQHLRDGKRLFVLFDELFKGTNVRDAYDATLAITKKLACYGNCAFVISTHIIEVGEALVENAAIQFGFMPTIMNDDVPRYTYKLTEGITSDRQGMIIIRNEKIMEILDEAKTKQLKE